MLHWYGLAALTLIFWVWERRWDRRYVQKYMHEQRTQRESVGCSPKVNGESS